MFSYFEMLGLIIFDIQHNYAEPSSKKTKADGGEWLKAGRGNLI